MTQPQILAELKPWLAAYQTIESAFADWEKLAVVGDLDKSPLWKGYYSLFDLYTDTLAKRLGGDASTWLSWFIYDNECGKKQFKATANAKKKRPWTIRNIKDLSFILSHAIKY